MNWVGPSKKMRRGMYATTFPSEKVLVTKPRIMSAAALLTFAPAMALELANVVRELIKLFCKVLVAPSKACRARPTFSSWTWSVVETLGAWGWA